VCSSFRDARQPAGSERVSFGTKREPAENAALPVPKLLSDNSGMKKPYPSREKSRWEHALTRPLSRNVKFEVLELMRIDLFEYLDVLTTDPYDDNKDRAWLNSEIQRIADRLKELTQRRAKALGAALKARRVEYMWLDDPEAALCGDPQPGVMWQPAQKYWESVQGGEGRATS
jgi:hypothetical protein